MQTTSDVLMIRPVRFLSNPQTTASNAFQNRERDAAEAQRAALAEFDAYVDALRACGVNVLVVDDTHEPHTPDSIFPNNWLSLHADGRALIYPMEAENRRQERRQDILDAIGKQFDLRRAVDLSPFERDGHYHEGTGSMVFDHSARVAYVCRSTRSSERVMEAVEREIGYRPFWFGAADRAGKPIFHTNVMMSVGRALAVVCLESVADAGERRALRHSLEQGGKRVVDIDYRQLECFAGNMLELSAADGAPVFALSRQAWAALRAEQQGLLSSEARIALAPIDTIERLGGGGARCMVAEIFLPRRSVAQP
ncbi:arginine deiminase-related protein [Chromobacterium vaccinii]|uniref:citrulline utilization hydrolase CtlX n=1 Tax=Chromobacterium vaccinii TaxID=1108595 RepID=UPI001E30A03D|nr:arginine deiminase-related protein [Chromobacterium vaccinii]MCD4485574.1 arginine deiminase-related protein [Chromobacterium vaccinii]